MRLLQPRKNLTASEYQSQMVPFAMELANRISLRLEHHNSLTSFEIEDIETRASHLRSRTRLAIRPGQRKHRSLCNTNDATAAARLIRGSNRRRSNPPPGRVIDSLSKMVEGPDRKSEELNRGLSSADGTRRRQTNLATHFVTSSWLMPLSIRSTLCPAATVELRGFYERTTKTRSQTNSVYRDEKFRRF